MLLKVPKDPLKIVRISDKAMMNVIQQPAGAASILVYMEEGPGGVRRLLKRAFNKK